MDDYIQALLLVKAYLLSLHFRIPNLSKEGKGFLNNRRINPS